MSDSGSQRWLNRLDCFGAVLKQLTLACQRGRYDDLERAGLIKTFEFCLELACDVLSELLHYDGHTVKAPRAAIRKSFEVGYIDENDCEILLCGLESRSVMSHAYLSQIAVESEKLIKHQLHPLLMRLYQRLESMRTQ